MKRRIIVLGTKGMLGSMLVRHLLEGGHNVVALTRAEFDATKEDALSLIERLSLTKSDVLINAIAITNPSVSEDLLLRVNADLPHSLDALAREQGCTVVHTSTDGVFSGKDGGYWESCVPDADDSYGRTKRIGDEISHSVVLRTSLIGPEVNTEKHFLSWVLAQSGKEVRGYTNHTWNGITTRTYAKAIEQFLHDRFPSPGLYHLFSPRILTKYDLIQSAARVYNIPLSLVLHHAPTPIMRHLATEKDLCVSLSIPDIEVQLADLRS